MNEGFATFWHERILRQLFNEGMLDSNEHSECNYTNSLVKAKNPYSMNPYLVGFEVWEDLVKRWDKGQHGMDWEEIESHEEKINYDDGSMKGMEKMFTTLRTSNDWMFMNDFLTNDLVKKLELYLYLKQENIFVEELVIADRKPDELREMIVKSFSHSGIPKIFVDDGNFMGSGELYLRHEFIGAELYPEYAQKTLDHILFLWGNKCLLETKRNKQDFLYNSQNKKNEVEQEWDLDKLDF
jgi:stage V sporulation protein R